MKNPQLLVASRNPLALRGLYQLRIAEGNVVAGLARCLQLEIGLTQDPDVVRAADGNTAQEFPRVAAVLERNATHRDFRLNSAFQRQLRDQETALPRNIERRRPPLFVCGRSRRSRSSGLPRKSSSTCRGRRPMCLSNLLFGFASEKVRPAAKKNFEVPSSAAYNRKAEKTN